MSHLALQSGSLLPEVSSVEEVPITEMNVLFSLFGHPSKRKDLIGDSNTTKREISAETLCHVSIGCSDIRLVLYKKK